MMRFSPEKIDWILVIPLILIPIFGLLMLLSSATDLFYRQLISMVLGLVVVFLVSRLDREAIKLLAVPAYIFSLVLLVLVFFFADQTRGSYRWLAFGGGQIQPSELMKPFLIVFFAYILMNRPPVKLTNVALCIGLFLIPFILVFREPDLGSAVVLVCGFGSMLFLSGVKLRYFLAVLITVLVLLPIGWHFTQPYQRARVTAFLNPKSDPLGKSYNINQSVIAVGSGQFIGRGLGQGTQTQLKFLPEHTTDFIFASLGEELGFIGAFALLILYTIIFWRLVRLSERMEDRFAALILSGSAIMLVSQAYIHIGGNIGILPVTGITLPLVSYGGSSVLATAILFGIILSMLRAHHQETKLTTLQ